jgi:hypothetical protein
MGSEKEYKFRLTPSRMMDADTLSARNNECSAVVSEVHHQREDN